MPDLVGRIRQRPFFTLFGDANIRPRVRPMKLDVFDIEDRIVLFL
jgi:hypothetical protein